MIRLAPFYLVFLCFLGFSGVVVAQLQAKPPQKNISSNEETQTKTAKAFYAKLKGDWKGSYSLWLRPGTPAQKSDINANFQSAAKGSYSMGKGPAWGWRTEFTQQDPNSLLMEAYNIMPNGVEALAVKAELKRVIKDEK